MSSKKIALAALALMISSSCSRHFQTLVPGDTYHPYECKTFERLADGRVMYRCIFMSDHTPGYTFAVFLPTLPDTVSVTPCELLNATEIQNK